MAAIRPTDRKDAKVNVHTQNQPNTHKEKNLDHTHDYDNHRKERSPQLPHRRHVGHPGPRGTQCHRRSANRPSHGPLLAQALPDDPDDKADPDKVRELTRRTLDTWREVRKLTHGVDAATEPFQEQIDLEVMALTMDADDPERLEKTAASAVEAAGQLLSFHGQALLGGFPVATA